MAMWASLGDPRPSREEKAHLHLISLSLRLICGCLGWSSGVLRLDRCLRAFPGKGGDEFSWWKDKLGDDRMDWHARESRACLCVLAKAHRRAGMEPNEDPW